MGFRKSYLSARKIFFLCSSLLSIIAATPGARAGSEVVITVDDLPFHGNLPAGYTRLGVARSMLRAFRREEIFSVYGFLNGKGAAEDAAGRAVLRAWMGGGHALGNHTFSHLDLNLHSAAAYRADIAANERTLRLFSPRKEWRFFRYPFLHEGNTAEKRTEVRRFLAEGGYTVAPVTVSFQDYAWNEPFARCRDRRDRKAIRWLKESFVRNALLGLDRAEALARKLFGRSLPQILLLHVGALEAEALPDLLAALKARGTKFVSLPEALRDPAFRVDPGLPFENGGFFFSQVLNARGISLADLGLGPLDNYPAEKLNTICR